ncbi:hypothetical protein RN001_005741 [Aquatica leii]|uniref:Carbonic anhydrase n=1 Tax=Aquatica leii TaxID=1421715 RepID=A0AAN7SI29_9COLE|nr:hypothetical protein RN001_005741 [Aquatica leii]
MLTLRSFVVVSVIVSVNCQNCAKSNGIRQSPVNINTLNLIYDWAPSLKWSFGYALTPESVYINNTGSSFSLTVKHKWPLEISSGVLDVPYKFDQLHFHWGDHNGIGSEHTIDGFTYPLEMHVVHSQNTKNDADQIVVVAYFFKVSSIPNLGLQSLLDKMLEAGPKKHEIFEIKPFALSQLLPEKFSYLTYKGSLTTPPYTESVTWIISTLELPISESQLDVFRETSKMDQGLKNNFRCGQDLNFRDVRLILEPVQYSHSSAHMLLQLFLFVAVVTALGPDCIQNPGAFQSPIDIDTKTALIKKIGKLEWSTGYNRLPENATLISNGHTVSLEMVSRYPMEIKFPLFPVKYKFIQLHFHWGNKFDVGSEHTMNNKSYPMEMHVVHTQTENLLYPKYIVLGYFLSLTRKGTTGLEEIIPAVVPAATTINAPIPVKRFKLLKFLGSHVFPYYTYQGSLTTTPYDESVRWIVAKNPLSITRKQLDVFYKAAQIEIDMLNNYRCTQDPKV